MDSTRIAVFHGKKVAVTAATTALATATALTGGYNEITTSVGETGVKLPEKYQPGVPVFLLNLTATAALVFPGNSTQKINNGSAGASVSLAQNKPALATFDGTNWLLVIGA